MSSNGHDKSAAIDTGLRLLSAVAMPGVCYTRDEIAAWCGCTDALIYLVEKEALKRLRRTLTYTGDPVLRELGRELFQDHRFFSFSIFNGEPLMRRPPLERMVIIYALLLRDERHDVASFAERLESNMRSIQLDLNFMRDRIGLPIVYNAKRRSWEVLPNGPLPWWLLRPGDKGLRKAIDEVFAGEHAEARALPELSNDRAYQRIVVNHLEGKL